MVKTVVTLPVIPGEDSLEVLRVNDYYFAAEMQLKLTVTLYSSFYFSFVGKKSLGAVSQLVSSRKGIIGFSHPCEGKKNPTTKANKSVFH